MIQGKTKSGFEYAISEQRFDNYDLIEALADVSENQLLVPKIINLLLDSDQTNRLKEHVRDKNGVVSLVKLMKEVEEILGNNGEIKNS